MVERELLLNFRIYLKLGALIRWGTGQVAPHPTSQPHWVSLTLKQRFSPPTNFASNVFIKSPSVSVLYCIQRYIRHSTYVTFLDRRDRNLPPRLLARNHTNTPIDILFTYHILDRVEGGSSDISNIGFTIFTTTKVMIRMAKIRASSTV